jgi:hypothetical protein
VWPSVLTLGSAFALAAGVAGCIFIDDSAGGDSGGNPPPTTTPPVLDDPKTVSITTDKTLETGAGDGVGVFVEYAAGGHWRVFTACDTNKSKLACDFEAFLIPAKDAAISNVQGEGLEGGDFAELLKDGSAHLSASTSTEFDGMTFDATPGATVELEIYFEGYPEPRVVYWFGDDTLHTGAPTDPIDFAPNTP